MSLVFFAPNPTGLSFTRWSATLCEELAGYNLPNPVSEGSWRDWAEQLFAIPELVELGVADPRGFATWWEWAANVSQVST